MYRISGSCLIAAVLCVALLQQSAAQVLKREDAFYKESAARLKQEIWGMDIPQFKAFSVPEKFKGYSKVILVNYNSLKAGDAIEVKNPLAKITHINRRLIKLNDAAAVREYSELSYQQLTKVKDYHNFKWSEFIGVKVIKPDGKTTEVPADEIVFTKDEPEQRRAKLAVPNLEPGDMLDIYTAEELSIAYDLIRTFPFYFDFYNNAPTLHQELHCIMGEKFATEYRCYNGAPDFKVTKNERGNTLLDLATDSVTLVPSGTKWLAPMRQLPVIELNVVRGDAVPYTPFTRRKPGELFKDQDPEKFVRDAMINLNLLKTYVLNDGYMHMRVASEVVDKYYQTLVSGGRTLQEDSAAAELYYMFRFDYMFGNLSSLKAERIANLTKADINTSMYAYLLSEYFKRHGMAAEVVLATSNHGAKMSELTDVKSLNFMCNVHGKHDMLFGMNDLYAPAFMVPGELEGITDAVAVDTKNDYGSKMASNYTERRIEIPQSGAQDNVHQEMLSIKPDPEHDGLRIARSTSLTGHFKEGIQHNLLPVEDFYNYEHSFFNDEYTLAEHLTAYKTSSAAADELTAAFAAAREEQKNAFLKEAKAWLELDITDQTNIDIVSPGVRHTEPAFTYTSVFRVNGLLKRAGDNYLVEVGKLTGNPARLADAQRARTLDVYTDYPRTTQIAMNLRIPDGYTAEGVEALNKSLQTGAGSFKATAAIDDNVVNIRLESVLAASYYASKDWPQLLSILDAMADWTGSKILLRKKS